MEDNGNTIETTEQTTKNKIERVKNHVRDNRNTYVAGISGFIVGVVGVLAFRKERIIPTTVNSVIAEAGGQHNGIGDFYQRISMYGRPLGRPGRPVINVGSGARFESETLAAKSVGVSVHQMSKHLHGDASTLKGQTFQFA